MGRILFIRVSAVTYDEELVLRAWPKLYLLAYPALPKGADSPASMVRKVMGNPTSTHGVLDLVDALLEHARFADAGEITLSSESSKKLSSLREQFDAALGERDVPTAHRLSCDIEDSLDDAEKNM